MTISGFLVGAILFPTLAIVFFFQIKDLFDNPYPEPLQYNIVHDPGSAVMAADRNEFRRKLNRYRSLSRKGMMRQRTLWEIITYKFPPFPPFPPISE